MLSVDHYELIRRKHLIDGLSIRAISRERGHSRNTIRKVLAVGTPPGYRRGYRVRFFTACGLANLYREAREERQVLRLEKQIRKHDLIHRR